MPAAVRTLVFLVSLVVFLNWLLLTLYHLHATTLTAIPPMGTRSGLAPGHSGNPEV